MTAARFVMPEDYHQLLPIAEELLHARTLQLFRGTVLPPPVRELWDNALMLQIAFMDGRGGLAAIADPAGPSGSVTLGRFSISGANGHGAASSEAVLSPAVTALLPALLAAGRGLHDA